MVSQHQFNGMRIKIVLLFQIGFIEFPDIMVDQHNRDDERDIAIMIRVNDSEQFLFLVRGEVLFEITYDMVQDIGVLFGCGKQPQSIR